MGEDFEMRIEIPVDNEGYSLLECENCGTFFKTHPSDIQDDAVLHIFCPSCGLISENYLTDDVVELAMNTAQNYMNDMIYDMFKGLEKQSKNNILKFKVGYHKKHQAEDPIRSGIEAMKVVEFPCCKRTAKIKPLLRMTGCYCIFCGVKNYEVE